MIPLQMRECLQSPLERGQIKSVQRLIRGVFDTGIENETGLNIPGKNTEHVLSSPSKGVSFNPKLSTTA